MPTATGCQPGTAALGRAIAAVYPTLTAMRGPYGCFNRRRISGAQSWSLHAEGRALDVGVPGQLEQLGWTLACDLVAHRLIYGTMRVMWSGHIWSVERIDEWQRLRPSSDQHDDHLHVEQFWHAARRPRTVQDELERALRAGRA